MSTRLAHWLFSCCLLLAFVAPASAQITINNPGTQAPNGSAKFKCADAEGTVTVNVNLSFTEKTVVDSEHYLTANASNGISLGISGTNCDKCVWLQFVWREIFMTPPNGTEQRIGANLKLPNEGSYPATTDPNAPNYHTDSGSPTNPAYPKTTAGAGGTSNTMVDAPTGGNVKAPSGWSGPRMVAHYDAFLICGSKVCLKVSWTATWTYDANGSPGATSYDVSAPDTSGNPPNAAEKAALSGQYPNQTLLK